MDVNVNINSNFELEASGYKGVVDECESIAQQVADVARVTAPRNSGAYAASIGVEKFRSGARVVARVPYAGNIEFGTVGASRSGKWVFYRAAKSLGLKFKKGR
jgi:hypothetical protein